MGILTRCCSHDDKTSPVILDELAHAVVAAVRSSIVQQLRMRYRKGTQGESVIFHVYSERADERTSWQRVSGKGTRCDMG